MTQAHLPPIPLHPDDYNDMVLLGQIVFEKEQAVYEDTGRPVVIDDNAPRIKKKAPMGMGVRAKMTVKLTVEKAK